jgi:hypothetical protein
MLAPLSAITVILADSNSSTYTPSFPGGGIIAWLICYSQRKKPIGGFLMFYYWSLYAGIFVSLLLFGANLQSYVPESFEDEKLYHSFLLSVVPLLIVYFMQVIVASLMLRVRSWGMLKLLRGLLLAELACALIEVAIHMVHFEDNLPLDAYTVVCTMIWVTYFFISKRVSHVFELNDWEIAVDTFYPPNTPKAENVG